MLIDNFNRKINYLRISVTDKCNLRCLYCMPEEGIKLLSHEKILTLENLFFFIKTSVSLGVNKIRITGGEPLLRRNIFFLIKSVSKLEGVNDLSITTNGVLLEKYIDQLIDSGIKRINVSLDTLDKEKFRFISRRDYFDNVIHGIKLSVEKGLNPVKVNIVAIRNFNDSEITDFINFGIENNVEIRFIEFMPFGDSEHLRFISKDEIISRIKEKFSITPASNHPDGPAKMYKIEGYDTKIGFISPLTEHFCGKCNRIRLTCDGKLKTCLFADNYYDIFNEIKENNYSDLKKRLIEIIKEKPEKHKIGFKDYKFKKCQNEMRVIGG